MNDDEPSPESLLAMRSIHALAIHLRKEGLEMWQIGLALMSYGHAILEDLPDCEVTVESVH